MRVNSNRCCLMKDGKIVFLEQDCRHIRADIGRGQYIFHDSVIVDRGVRTIGREC